jgi:hypothetical protein
MHARVLRGAAIVALLVVLLPGGRPASAEAPANAPFAATWSRTDDPVADGIVSRTWMWGPEAFSGLIDEPYADSPGGRRTVQYFDKSRMEITHPNGDQSVPWYVTNGLLVVELVSGRLQRGDGAFIDDQPAHVNVAGDPDDPSAPTYATIDGLRAAAPLPAGAPVTWRLARDGSVTDDPSLLGMGVTAALRVDVPGISHQVASPFWAFMQSSGPIIEDGVVVTGPLFADPFYATGYPIAEAYWATVRVGGTPRDVLLQCFERRCLTYTPGNPEGWQVEAGNVGQHYYRWRYGDPQMRERNRERAIAAYDAMQAHFYRGDVHLYAETAPASGNPYAYHWPVSRAMAATLNMAGLPDAGVSVADVLDRLYGAERYWNAARTPPGYDSYLPPPLGPGGDLYYDDNAWTGLNLVRIRRLTGDAAVLERAKQVFTLLVRGWDDDAGHPAPGGVFWTQASWNWDRNTVSTGTAAQLGFHLYALTGDGAYLDWATRMYDWVYRYLRADNGLFWDHVKIDGQVERAQWSYNQGIMIGANVLRYHATGDAGYLDRAAEIADAAVALYAQDERYYGEPAFNAIYFENLLLLFAERPRPAWHDAMQSYADRIWETARDPATNLFPVFRPVRLLDQAAMVEIYAALALDPARYGEIM